jgi:spiro-SPASM protein
LNICALLYVEDGLMDSDLTFANNYLPDQLKNTLQSTGLFSSVRFSVPAEYSGNLNGNDAIKRNDIDDVAFWKELFTEFEADHIVKIFCDSPFLDPSIISDMANAHIKYLAEFTYSENLPSGFSCEIISKDLLEAIPDQIEKTLPLIQIIKGNINRFDVELYFKEPDIRDKRISFRSGNLRDKQIMLSIYKSAGQIPQYSGIKKIIDDDPSVLYLCPSYVEIEITGRCQLDCIFCYRKTLNSEHGDMDVAVYKKILSDMSEFNLPYSVCFGGSGEPLLHKNFYEIMDATRKELLIENIIIETNGILADNNFRSYLANSSDKRIKVIFNINGIDDLTYKNLHGADYYNTVRQNVLSVKEVSPADGSIYIQIMKINETEPFLDKFYDFWEKNKVPIILQKQNTFLGQIEDRSYSDLSPLERTPCWHLQRDITILSGGKAAFCKQDINGDHSRGNINEESILHIFQKTKTSFLNDYSKKYPAKPDCSSCGEWYTFNF